MDLYNNGHCWQLFNVYLERIKEIFIKNFYKNQEFEIKYNKMVYVFKREKSKQCTLNFFYHSSDWIDETLLEYPPIVIFMNAREEQK